VTPTPTGRRSVSDGTRTPSPITAIVTDAITTG
jgi:hypothetical protein